MNLFTDEHLENLPEIYAQDGKGGAAVVHLRVNLLKNNNWFITEYSPEEKLFFGFVCLGADLQNAELGYISKTELEDLSKTYPQLQVERVEMSLDDAKAKYIN